MEVNVHGSIAEINPEEWNRAAGNDYPFLRHDFLLAAESSGSVSPETGWLPRHLSLRAADGSLRAALLLYEKSHSWGEFVFDWAWADAYRRAGLEYYPKLVSAVPFTPASSPRLLLADRSDVEAASGLLAAATELASRSGCSSLHVLFPAEDELPLLEAAGLKLRKDCQFHWHNRGYTSFDDFLSGFSAKKRKNARRDRRLVTEAGIRYRRYSGADLDDGLWREVYRLISITFMQRGSTPYFGLDFFRSIGRSQGDSILVVAANRGERMIAAAVFFAGSHALYGRYWGAEEEVNALHFETCYYQGIDYCIEKGLELFEPGTQGEHKVSRGFAPRNTWSAHWLRQPEFFSAVGDYLQQEGRQVERYMDAIDRHTPYKADRLPHTE
ncbi:MAG: GNAT family N-acetyltransferase [Pseudomonadota bacterium]